MSKVAAFQFLIKVEGWDGYFVQRTGGETSAQINKVYDGGAEVPDTVNGRKDVSNVICSRHFDTTRDAPIRQRYKNLVGSWTTTVSVTPTDENFVPVATPDVYPNARLQRLSVPNADAQSSDVSMFEAEFVVTQVT